MQIHSRGQTTLHQNCSQISSTRLVELYVCINWCVCVQMCATNWYKQRLRLYSRTWTNISSTLFSGLYLPSFDKFKSTTSLQMCVGQSKVGQLITCNPALLLVNALESTSEKSYPDKLFPKRFGTLTPTNASRLGQMGLSKTINHLLQPCFFASSKCTGKQFGEPDIAFVCCNRQ